MAEGIAFGLAANLLSKVVSSAFQEIGLLYGVKDELKKLENTLTIINAVLVDAEEQQERSHAVRIWIKRLEQAFYDADDLLDNFAYQDLRRKLDKRMARQVSDFFSSSNQLACRLKMGHTIKEIRGRLDEIANDISKFNFLSKTVMPLNTRFFGNRERETVSDVSTSEITGRDIEKEEIIEKLIGPDSNTSDGVPPVIAIVGIGGLGKTSLAKLVFNDKRVAEHFEPRIWVCVSEDFDRKLIVKNILECITKESVEKLDLEPLQVRLRQTLGGKKYLLVLDDVWNEEKDKWIQLKEMLMAGASGASGANGSQIAVTTRSVKVASAMGIDSPYLLKGLSNELSWKLFERLAFGKQLEKVHPKVIEIGKELIKRCKGVPLAIRTLGSTMGSKTSESEWLSIQNSEIWSSSSNESGILSVLKLSYDQLPTHIKHCFAYCSIFPKDYYFESDALIQLWMAQGYIQTSSDKCQTLENIGGQYVQDLLSISFFQELEVDKYNITSFKMHDLIHDLAIEVAGYNCYFLTKSSMENGDYDESIRHISLLEGELTEELPRRLLKAKGMRTLFCIGGRHDWEMGLTCQRTIMLNLTCLRVLDLKFLGIKKLSSSICTLKHLRYLDLSDNDDLEGLPNSISNLLNLQTLKLSDCRSIKQLPRDITKLINLRYLMMERCYSLTHMPSGLGNLTMMQRLSLFVVGGDDKTVGHSRYGGLDELKGLNDLRGEIWITNLEKVGADDAGLEILKEKQHLQSLILCWRHHTKRESFISRRHGTETESAADTTTTTAELVLEGLEPHPNLKEFEIRWYCGVRFPSWMIKMVNVVNITLWECHRCQLLQPLDQLPCLKFLSIYELDSLEYIQEEEEEDYDNKKQQVRDGHPPPSSSSSSSTALFFPSLQQLKLQSLWKLKGWWKRRESVSEEEEEEKYTSSSSSSSLVFPQLTEFTIHSCPMLSSMPLHPNLENLEVYGVSEKLVRERLTTRTTTTSAEEEDEEKRKVDDDYHHHQMSSSSSSISSFSSIAKLKSLNIRYIKDLEVLLPEFLWKNLTGAIGEGEGFSYVTSLRTLEIRDCAKLKSISREVQHLTALDNLLLNYCPELELSDDDDGIHWQCLRSLRKLDISEIPKLVTLPVGIQHLTQLQHLEIGYCSKLKSISREVQHLTALENLTLKDCPELELSDDDDGMHWQGLKSLRELEISKIPKLVTLPVGFQHLTTLQHLQIHDCRGFLDISDWVGNLTHLQLLRFSYCDNFSSLPQEIRCLTSLQQLQIDGCPKLSKRCQKGTGEDWLNIAHIPNILIDEYMIQGTLIYYYYF